MKTQEMIIALEGLIAGNKIEITISLLRKLLKPIDKDLYHQVIQLSASFVNSKYLARSGALTPEEENRHRSYIAHALLDILEKLEEILPTQLDKYQTDLATHLLKAAEGVVPAEESIRPLEEEVILPQEEESFQEEKRHSYASSSKKNGWIYLTFAGWTLFFLSLVMNYGKADPYEGLKKQEIYQIAAQYGLTEINGLNAHLRFSEADFNYWYDKVMDGLSMQDLEQQFAYMYEVLIKAEKQRREIFTPSDLELLAIFARQKNFEGEAPIRPSAHISARPISQEP